MTNIRTLLASLAAQETQFGETRFLAPCVQGGRVRARVAGLVQTFRPVPDGFEGWGIFQPTKHGDALLVEEVDLPLVADYCRLLMPLRLRLAHALSGQTWLAYPVNEGDACQRLGAARPVAVHLVTDGEAFEPILARGDGRVWWFEDGDRRADPQPADRLREALRAVTLPDAVRFAGLTPEMRTAYGLAARQSPAFAAQAARLGEQTRRQRQDRLEARARTNDEGRLRDALRVGGGDLRGFRDRGDFWQVEWSTRDGGRQTSAISKSDLTVMSSGICLSGLDHHFDLQSLVGVIERRGEDWYD